MHKKIKIITPFYYLLGMLLLLALYGYAIEKRKHSVPADVRAAWAPTESSVSAAKAEEKPLFVLYEFKGTDWPTMDDALLKNSADVSFLRGKKTVHNIDLIELLDEQAVPAENRITMNEKVVFYIHYPKSLEIWNFPTATAFGDLEKMLE